MIAKLKIVEEEADETMYWLELLAEAELAEKPVLRALHAEANELLSIVVATIKSLRAKRPNLNERLAKYGEAADPIFNEA